MRLHNLLTPMGILAATLVLVGTSCTTAAGPPADRSGVEGNGSVAELRLRWGQWKATGIRSYRYHLVRTCFCTIETVTPARVEVRDGVVVDVRALATGQPLPFAFVPTIDLLFEWAIREAENDGHVEVTYNPLLSYPIRLVIGTLANDAGVAYDVTDLVRR